MRLLAINGSGRKKGNTAETVSCIEKSIRDKIDGGKAFRSGKNTDLKFDFEHIFLHDYDLQHCRGCRVCMDINEDKCPVNDDFHLVLDKIHRADVIILASPVFVGDVSSIMKALLDRMAYLCHRQALYTKMFYLVATTYAVGTNHTIRTLGSSIFSWGSYLIGKCKIKMMNVDDKAEIGNEYSKKIKKAAEKILKAYSDEKYKKPSVVALITFKIQKKYKADPDFSDSDSEYWRAQGWVDPQVQYYIPPDVSRCKIAVANILFPIIDSLFIS